MQIESVLWDDEETGPALRKFYALENEAQETLVESKRQWEDTAFSLFALQSKRIPVNTLAII